LQLLLLESQFFCWEVKSEHLFLHACVYRLLPSFKSRSSLPPRLLLLWVEVRGIPLLVILALECVCAFNCSCFVVADVFLFLVFLFSGFMTKALTESVRLKREKEKAEKKSKSGILASTLWWCHCCLSIGPLSKRNKQHGSANTPMADMQPTVGSLPHGRLVWQSAIGGNLGEAWISFSHLTKLHYTFLAPGFFFPLTAQFAINGQKKLISFFFSALFQKCLNTLHHSKTCFCSLSHQRVFIHTHTHTRTHAHYLHVMSVKREFYVDFEVKFGKTVLSIEMPASASVHDLKQRLEEKTQVRAEKQRLLLNLPVMKEKHRDPSHDTVLRHLFPAALVERFEQHDGHVAQHLKVNAMLLGSVEVAPPVNVAATTEISRLVATTVEHDGKWYRCSYSKGYLLQTAYVCRTCVNEGRAAPQHALCLACAEFCHGDHEVEEWGVRHYMRCDCCTEKCWRPTTASEGNDSQTKATEAENRSTTDAAPGVGATVSATEVRTVHSHDIEQRTVRKRSRSTSPLTPKRSRGSSPMSVIRMTTIPPTDMPDLDLLHPTNKGPATTAALSGSSRVGATATTAAGRSSGGGGGEVAASTGFPSVPSPVPAESFDTTPEKCAAAAAAHSEVTETTGDTPNAPTALPRLSRCAFVIDSKTKRAPVESILPSNKLNRYPRDPLNWCYCKMPQPSNDPECGGIACLLCTSCYWSTHITKLFTRQYRRVSCYGDVLVGDTVAFKCTTCDTYVCAPCRYRCHKDHVIAPGCVVPSVEDGTDNGARDGANFRCGCRELCAIAETVPQELIDDESSYALISDADAAELLKNDIFTGFVCAYCMQEHPWLTTEDPLKCYHGELPPTVEANKPVIACGTKAASPVRGVTDTDTFPYHGMLLPADSFTPDMTCSCAPCRAAYEKFAPRPLEDATEMIMELHDHCDNCEKSVKDQQAFMCRTCEMNMEDTFFICKDCNALREMLVERRSRVPASSSRPPDASTSAAEAGEGEDAASHDTGAEMEHTTTHEVDRATSGFNGYTHDLSHEFIEDTFENLYALCGMQMMQSMDPEVQEYVASNWNPEASQMEVANTLSQSLGQIPLQFSDEELREMASLNQRRKQSKNHSNHHHHHDSSK
jgi:hypothetical protein